MRGRVTGRVLGVGLVLALLVAIAAVLAVQAAHACEQVLAPAPLRTDDAVVAVAAGAGAAVAAWLALGAGASAVLVLRGSARRPTLVPAVVHRAVALLLGVAVAAGPSVPTPGPPTSSAPAATGPAATGTHAPSDLDPGWSAVRAATGVTATPGTASPTPTTRTATPTATAAPATPTAPGRVVVDPGWRAPAPPPAPPATVPVPADPLLLDGRRAVPDERTLVTVRRGDTLWDLAARHLGPQATDAEIAAEWPRWYATNRDVVGDDPDLLLPGRQLRAPGDAGNRP